MAELERFGHGGDLVTAAELFRKRERDLIDFSSNIYPYGPPDIAIEAIHQALAEPGLPALVAYPDPDARKLKGKLAHLHGIEETMILPGNGAAELIDLLIVALNPKRVGVIEPAFVEYRLNANKRRIPVDTIITRWEDGFVPEPEEVCRLIRQVDLLFVGLPNNPSGHLLPGKLLERMAEEAQASATWLAVDEAFISLVTNGEERSLIQKIARFPRVIVLRSLTKLFALPGLRLGYVVAEPGLINRLKRMQVSWSVNGLAQRVGWVVAEPHFYAAYVKEAQTWLVRERWDLREALARAFPVRIFPGEANYLLVRIEDGRWTAWRLQQALGERGFLIRDCSMYPGLDKRYFRIAVKRRAENEALVKALADVWDKEG